MATPYSLPFKFLPSGYAEAPKVGTNFDSVVSIVNTLAIGSFTDDITVTTAGAGLVLKTPDGLHTYRIGISNDGNITTEQLT